MEVVGKHFFIIDGLLQQSLGSRLFKEKKYIIENGGLKPVLNILTEKKTCTRHFSTKLYDSTKWFIGCKIKNKFFCWPCLLFSTESNV